MNKIISLLAISVLMFTNNSFAQAKAFTDRELMIYHEWTKETEALDIDDTMEDDEEYFRLLDEGYKEIDIKVSQKYGLAPGELENIINRANAYELTDWDRQLLAVIGQRLPPPYTEEDSNRVFRGIADKYGISFYRVYFINNRKFAEIAEKFVGMWL